jgi:hypothetical protein
MPSVVTFALVTDRLPVVVLSTGTVAAGFSAAPTVLELEPPQAASAAAPASEQTTNRAATFCTRATLRGRESE